MGVVAAILTTQNYFPQDITSQSGIYASVSLIILLSMAELISASKYWNRWVSSSLVASYLPILVTFTAIVVFKIFMII